MSKDAIQSLQTNLDDLAAVLATLSAEEWQAPSACEGWRVQDVVAHMNSSAKLMTGEKTPPATEGDAPGAEDMAELLIADEKTQSWEAIYADFQRLGEPFVAALGGMQEEPIASVESNFGDLGTHPTHILANAFAFDTYCHLRHDIVGAATSIERDLPDATDERLRPGIDWMLAGLPQMCTAALAPVATAPVRLVLTGPGGGTWTLGAVGDDGLVPVTESADGDVAATVTSSAHDFYSWGTTRSDWRDACSIDGDAERATAVLDAINII